MEHLVRVNNKKKPATYIESNIGGTLIWWIAENLCFEDLILAMDTFGHESNTHE